MFLRLIGAIERIQYQHASPLFKDLTELAQRVIDVLSQDDLFQKLSGVEVDYYVSKVLVRINFGRDCVSIIEKHLNYKIYEIEYCISPSIYAAICGFFVYDGIEGVTNSDAGYEYGASSSVTANYKKLISDIVKNYDTDTGVIYKSINKKNKQTS